MSCIISLIRYSLPPYEEGGTKVSLELIKGLKELRYQTILLGFDYKSHLTNKPPKYQKNYHHVFSWIWREHILNGSFSHIAIASMYEFFTSFTSINKALKACKGEIIILIGNATKYISIPISILAKLTIKKPIQVLLLYQRNTLYSTFTRIFKPLYIMVFSQEMSLVAKKVLGFSPYIFQLYPFVDTELYRPSLEKREEILNRLGAEKLILYLGRVNNIRFPLHVLKKVLKTVKTMNDVKILLVLLPSQSTYIWLHQALLLIHKLNVRNKVNIIVKYLSEKEKSEVYSASRIFIFPSEKNTAAIEPPLTVLEAVSSGLTVVSSGTNSTKEITQMTNGYIFNENKLESQLEEILCHAPKINIEARQWALKNISWYAFLRNVEDIFKNFDVN